MVARVVEFSATKRAGGFTKPHNTIGTIARRRTPPERTRPPAFSYKQDVSGPGSASSRLWVGRQDGRPRRLESEEGTMRVVVTLDYEGVTPPDLHEPAPP